MSPLIIHFAFPTLYIDKAILLFRKILCSRHIIYLLLSVNSMTELELRAARHYMAVLVYENINMSLEMYF